MRRVAVAGFAVLFVSGGEAVADCMSACQSGYYACAAGFNARDCATQRSICQNRCIMSSDSFGAIAYSPTTGAFGFSFDYRSRTDAQRRALAECQAQGGAEDCEVEVWFRNHCAALATGGDEARGSAHAATKAAAEAQALDYCREANDGSLCEILTSLCSK